MMAKSPINENLGDPEEDGRKALREILKKQVVRIGVE